MGGVLIACICPGSPSHLSTLPRIPLAQAPP